MTRFHLAPGLVLPFLTHAALAGPVPLGDDGLHKPDWLKNSFKVLAEDNQEAAEDGRHLLLMVEQRGCIYCAKLHNEVLTDPRVEALIRSDFDVIQIDLFGGTEITDIDGEELTEKRAAGKWGVTVTPTLMLLPHRPVEGADAARAAMAVLPGVLGPEQMIALLEWVRMGGPDSGRALAEVIGQ